MAYYIKNLKDANGDIIYPISRSTAIYLSDNTLLQTYLDNLAGLQIAVSATQPTTLNAGDFWYDTSST